MSLKGNLDTFFLNSIFQLLSADQKTGILMVQNTQKQVKIYFQDGDIVYATGNQKENRLGTICKAMLPIRWIHLTSIS
jgi:hypothetical protein